MNRTATSTAFAHPAPGRTIRARCPQPCCRDKRGESLAVTGDDDGRGRTWLCHRCGWTGGERDDRASERAPRLARPAPAAPKNVDRAAAIWRETRPAPGTLTDLWLRDRGIRFAIPAPIRHHPALAHWHGRELIGLFPAMVVRMDDPAGGFIGVHRTWLSDAITPDPIGKAPVPDPRMSLGNLGVAWLGRRDVAAIIVGEGVETVLAASELGADPLPVWGGCCEPDGGPHPRSDDPPEPYGVTPVACICAAGFRRFDPPATVRRLYIAEDDDDAGRDAAAALAARARARGIAVQVLRGGR